MKNLIITTKTKYNVKMPWLLFSSKQVKLKWNEIYAIIINTLKVILKLDAFFVARGSCLLMSLTLSNFELLCKTSCLHFIIAIADCNDHERDIVA